MIQAVFILFVHIFSSLKLSWKKLSRENPVIAISLGLFFVLLIGFVLAETTTIVSIDELTKYHYYAFATIFLFLTIIVVSETIASNRRKFTMEKEAIRRDHAESINSFKEMLRNSSNKAMYVDMANMVNKMKAELATVCKGCKGQKKLEEYCALMEIRITHLTASLTHLMNIVESSDKTEQKIIDKTIS